MTLKNTVDEYTRRSSAKLTKADTEAGGFGRRRIRYTKISSSGGKRLVVKR